MRIQFSKKKMLLAALALALVATLGVGSAMAYFTTYSTASGTVEMNMGFTETIPDETLDQNGKHVTIRNVGDYDCFIRVKAFAPFELTYVAPNNDWTDGGDGYWYYNPVLVAGGTSSELNVSFEYPVNTEEETTEEFNVVVVQEYTPVVYDANNNPTANWDHVVEAE